MADPKKNNGQCSSNMGGNKPQERGHCDEATMKNQSQSTQNKHVSMEKSSDKSKECKADKCDDNSCKCPVCATCK